MKIIRIIETAYENRDIVGIIIFVLLIIFGLFYNKNLERDIFENQEESIAKVYVINRGVAGRCSIKYMFNFNNKTYYNSESSLSCKEYKKKINKFYKIIFSRKNPNHGKIFFNKEVKDSTIIENLNF